MNYDAVVCKGRPAWLPRRDAEELQTLHLHDFPLVGTFLVEGQTFLFACLTGAMASTNTWAYVAISHDESGELADVSFDTTADLERFVHGLYVDRATVFASAEDGLITRWSVEEVDESGLLAAAIRVMEMWVASRKPERAIGGEGQAMADAKRRELSPA